VSRVCACILVILSSAFFADASQTSSRPWIPDGSYVLPPVTAISTQTGVTAASRYQTVIRSQGPAATVYEMNPVKGDIGEAIGREVLRSSGWIPGTPARTGQAGIDLLHFKTDSSGNIRGLMVTEAKYGASRLAITKDGLQMSREWIGRRLDYTAREYGAVGREVRGGQISRAGGWERLRATNKIDVPLRDGQRATVWKSNGGIKYYCANDRITSQEIEKQAIRTSQYLRAAAQEQITYRSRIFRYDSAGKIHKITIEKWDPKLQRVFGRPEVLESAFRDLPRSVQSALRRAFIQKFEPMSLSGSGTWDLAREACENPDFFKTMSRFPRHTFSVGLDRVALWTGAGAGGATFLIDTVLQLATTGELDSNRSAVLGGIGSISAFSGYYCGSQINVLLTGTTAGRNILTSVATRSLIGSYFVPALGSIGGGIIASGLFTYGLYGLGFSDLQTAHRGMFIGSMGAVTVPVVWYGTLYMVTTFATAGTGTAIGSLNGIVATNAALAWLGGGPLAAGGWGVAGGTTVLTAGTAIVVIAVVATVSYTFYLRDLAKQEKLIQGRLKIVTDLANQGRLTNSYPALSFL
jgi:hypothetical protein